MNLLVYRARRFEVRIQQMLWKINFADIVSTVCVTVLLAWGEVMSSLSRQVRA